MNDYADVRQMASLLLRRRQETDETSPETAQIEAAAREAMMIVGAEIDEGVLVADLEASFQTFIGTERILESDEDWVAWLNTRRGDISWRFWDRYRLYLAAEKAWPVATVDGLDRMTDEVLARFTDPQTRGPFDRRGMVVGHVQSGKTSHYTGLICKAADAGYKVIVVLTGFHNSLRTQTQIRLEEGFLGFDRGAKITGAGAMRPVGVGDSKIYGPPPPVNSVTTRANDFKKATARNFGIHPDSNPLLFVIKKNGTILKHLLEWVSFVARSQGGVVNNVPLLVIDDEADQGSIDTSKGPLDEFGDVDPDHEPTTLNRRIRLLLHKFQQSAYVGYTATPFANIFIHELPETKREGRDLFPSSFIVSLPTPSNYIGPTRVFGLEADDESQEALPIIRDVTDHAATLDLKETAGWMPPRPPLKTVHVPLYDGKEQIPTSLKEAVQAFALTIAARSARGDADVHNSMLVHVTRFTKVQARVAEQVQSALFAMRQRLRHGDRGDDGIESEFRGLWKSDFEPTTRLLHARNEAADCQALSWDDILPFLRSAVDSIDVKEINGKAADVLDYVEHAATGLNVIAVGGDKLSRGLTLEGLSVSYFLRSSKMYDTLMQMGRWFGYRPRYLDLCRLYTPPELSRWFAHIAEASAELRDDFNRMAASSQTPKEFGHRVRSHPVLMVTSGVKMRTGTRLKLTFNGDLSQTIDFHRDKAHLQHNWIAGQHLVETVEDMGIQPEPYSDRPRAQGTGKCPRYVWRDVPAESILSFLDDYQEHDASRRVKTRPLADYIRRELEHGRLTNWTILLGSGGAGDDKAETVKLGHAEVQLVSRSYKATTNGDYSELVANNHYRIGTLVNPPDELADFDPELRQQILAARQRAKDGNPRHGDNYYTDHRARRAKERGLVMLYPLWWGTEPAKKDSPQDAGYSPPPDKVRQDAFGTPILGVAFSFPRIAEAEQTHVDYVVNNVYMETEILGDSPE